MRLYAHTIDGGINAGVGNVNEVKTENVNTATKHQKKKKNMENACFMHVNGTTLFGLVVYKYDITSMGIYHTVAHALEQVPVILSKRAVAKRKRNTKNDENNHQSPTKHSSSPTKGKTELDADSLSTFIYIAHNVCILNGLELHFFTFVAFHPSLLSRSDGL